VDHDYTWLGIEIAESLIGIACYGPTPGADRTFDLYWIATDAASQGQGAGRRLLEGVESALRQRGARLIVAETSGREDYASTRAFYERCGYDTRATVRAFYAPGDDRVILVKRLDGPASS
jgi:ribosomal protein S18 acetylase RimI-like enzyme